MDMILREFHWGSALLSWAVVMLLALVIGYGLGSLLSAAARGSLSDGIIAAAGRVREFLGDLVALSPRRIGAITMHTIKESYRRRMLFAVLVVFVALFLFAGWYLPGKPIEQVKVYVSFVMLSSTIIAVIASALLACLGLPSDIKEQTIHTVVTKPVRRLEIVLGRVLGLTGVASVVLVVMGVISYTYLRRSVSNSLNALEQRLADARTQGDPKQVDKLKDDIAQIQSKMVARVPIFAKELVGPKKDVGYEHAPDSQTFRKYIEGATIESAIWRFHNIPVDRIIAQKPAKLPIEMTFEVFRTTKGEVGHGVVAEVTYRNAKNPKIFVTTIPFEVREYYVNRQELTDSPKHSLAELFEGSGGDLDVEVRCLSGTQYLGMARGDLYILLDTASFGMNFAKGIVGVWARVVLIICVAVLFSTFLNTFVALLATAAVFVGGLCIPYLRDVALGIAPGGGPIQALMRLIAHENLQSKLDPSFWTSTAEVTDQGLSVFLRGLIHVLPDLGFFNTAPLVANGFDISAALLLQGLIGMLAYAVPFTVVGYFLLQSREIAR